MDNKDQKPESWWDVIKFGITVALVVIPIRIFIAQPFLVDGESMVPTFQNHDYLIVDQLSYRVREPHRGEVIIFRYPYDTTRFFIKRTIGLPGDTITIANGTVQISNTTGTTTLDEPYISAETNSTSKVTLGPDEYFVMGDNRPFSSDSRSWGVLKREHITGRALVRLWPLKHIDLLPGDYSEKSNN
jgi:signal peptidase I